MSEALLRATHISKSFSMVQALSDVNFDLQKGEVHALLGENGAGKSTLMKIFSGVYIKDEGELFIKGQQTELHTPAQAQALGIGIIHQELNLCRHLTVAENIFLGREQTALGVTKTKEQNRRAQELLDRLNVDLDPRALVRELPVSKQQMVEICKTLSMNADIIIMDEPTSALTDKEIDDLFRIIHELKKQGKGIVYISHRLEELSRITDRITILRDGKFISTHQFGDVTLPEIIAKMVGRNLKEKFPRIESIPGKTVLEVKNLNAGKSVRNVSFEVRQGEILGLAGLMGAGRTETIRALFGADKKDSGTIELEGRVTDIRQPSDAIRAGIFAVPEDRKHDGLCVKLSVLDNLTIPNLDMVSVGGVLNRKKAAALANRMVQNLKIKTPHLNQYVRNLSGGNQQKIVVGKWLLRDAKIVMFDEPTRGIDVAAKVEIYNIMNELKKQGVGVLFVSSELPEILGMSDRVLVFCNGKITANLVTAQTNQEEILHYATRFE
ncbi:sugar ABC transporter ATP-binding protein [Treponema zuelzerae]|uniref:Sugar ABC transporter ATP-binding protein n=1 Tax=Teretinema zuelzerae TaxID=156 RepID=A0AAE3EGB1_9SPIR|nr:sugar ABC transporter ATP-binding protein [Teretinema zuelzerae]MCD1654144.1 sugar ABC transporter ATP-binding protein [Teretinema zuelzerae]